MKRRYLEEVWIKLAEHLQLECASITQQRESRRMFFAGADALLSILTNGVTKECEPTEGDMCLMEAISLELEAFTVGLLNGTN